MTDRHLWIVSATKSSPTSKYSSGNCNPTTMFRAAVSSLVQTTRSASFVQTRRTLTKTSFLLPDPSSDRGLQLSKIVATIGPTSEQREPLLKVTDAGMKIMRLNFSHATTEEVELRTENLALAQVSDE